MRLVSYMLTLSVVNVTDEVKATTMDTLTDIVIEEFTFKM